jgi:putative intracellular protease/amidase
MSPLSPLLATFRAIKRIPRMSFAYLAAILVLPVLVGFVNLGIKMHAINQPHAVPALTQPLPAPPAYDPAKPIAVVVASTHGAEVTDFLPTYDILARSGIYNVYVVAPERQSVPLISGSSAPTGLDVVPHFSFADYQTAIGRSPDLIAIPYFPGYTATRDAAVLQWLRAQAGPRTTFLGICAGTEELTDSGLLDGHAATTNTGWFARLEKRDPAVRWIHNVRYVDDGPVVTSTNLAAGMDATLHVVDRFGGRAVAAEVARQIGYPTTRYLDDPRWQSTASDIASIAPALADAAYRWGWEKLGLVLADGVGELSLASVADPYSSFLTTRIYTLAPERAPIRSQHGLYFVPEYTFASAPHLDRILTPSAADGEWPYDASLRDLAQHHGATAAITAGRNLFVATASGQSASPSFPIAPLVVVPALGLLGAGCVYGLGRLGRRQRHHAVPGHPSRARRVVRFALHFGEMMVAMVLGMVVLDPLYQRGMGALGYAHPDAQLPALSALAMTATMTLPMVAWMRFRGHTWARSGEMAGAMFVPAIGLIGLSLVGVLPASSLSGGVMIAMVPAMLGVMLYRGDEYSGGHVHAQHVRERPREEQPA